MGVKNSKWVFYTQFYFAISSTEIRWTNTAPWFKKDQGAVAVSPHARIFGVPRLSDLRAGKRSSEPFKSDTGDSGGRARGDAAHSMISMCCASELKRLSAVIQWISRVFSRVRFYIFEGRKSSGRKAVRQTPCRIHSGRQSRPHLLVFSRISVGKRQCVKHAYICGIGVSAIRKIPQNRRIFRLFAGVSRVSGVHTKKSISLQPRG